MSTTYTKMDYLLTTKEKYNITNNLLTKNSSLLGFSSMVQKINNTKRRNVGLNLTTKEYIDISTLWTLQNKHKNSSELLDQYYDAIKHKNKNYHTYGTYWNACCKTYYLNKILAELIQKNPKITFTTTQPKELLKKCVKLLDRKLMGIEVKEIELLIERYN